MNYVNEKTEGVIVLPEILLPKCKDMEAWAVIACDQFTSDKEYWDSVKRLTEGKLSTYNLIFPEIFLKDNPDSRTERINSFMREYLDNGVFKTLKPGFILVERTTPVSGTRTGIMICIDLESYSFRQEDKALIRSTEATVLDRLPPRVKIRQNAPIELPHVMLLYNDPSESVLKSVKRGEVLYDFELNMGGGHVKGTYIANSIKVKQAFELLVKSDEEDKMLFAVGDGNHSLAAAKMCWEKIKENLSESNRDSHPARYVLCEAVNIYDNALSFHPIYRFLKTDKPEKFVSEWNIEGKSFAGICYGNNEVRLPFPEDVPYGIRLTDEYIARFIKKYGGEADYIHGENELKSLTCGGVGIITPSIEKSKFFGLIKEGGNLPKKTFSMGEGKEKRYYIEAKRIK